MSETKTYGRKVVTGSVNRKKVFQRRLVASWGVCFSVGLVLGCLLVYAVSKWYASEPAKRLEPVVIESPSYGTIDNNIFINEIPLDWSSGQEADFVALDVPMDEEMQEFIYYLSSGYNIEFPFVMALIDQESSFQSNAVSGTDDVGLMQINKVNHEWLTETLGVTDFTDPYQNARCGIFILRKLFEKYEDPSKVLMAYNMGEGGASKLWEKGVFESGYSKNIMKTASEYEQQLEEKKNDQN